MTATLKNSWKLFAVSATRSKARHLRSIFQFITRSIELRFFSLFFVGLFSTYILFDVLTNSTLQSLGYSIFVDYSLPELFAVVNTQILLNFWESSILTKLSIFVLLVIAAYVLMVIVMRPIYLFNSRRRYFTSNIAHELNTPLSILKSTAEVTRMQGHEISQSEKAEFAISVIEEVDRMAEIVKYFLHFGTSEQKLQLPMSAVNITSVINKIVRTLSLFATECGVVIQAPKEEVGIVWGNFTALEEMLSGLVKNAIIHSPKGGIVKISLKNLTGHVEIGVFNDGQGISSTDLPYIFDPFYKGERGVHSGRLGLGLTIAREIAKIHLTEIDVHTDKKSGTEFTVKLSK